VVREEAGVESRKVSAFERAVIRAPSAIARPLAAMAKEPEQRWMLKQPRRVRVSYLRDIVDGPPIPRLEEFWMLRQPSAVRRSYVDKVLNRNGQK
jgi:hypothetical protein